MTHCLYHQYLASCNLLGQSCVHSQYLTSRCALQEAVRICTNQQNSISCMAALVTDVISKWAAVPLASEEVVRGHISKQNEFLLLCKM